MCTVKPYRILNEGFRTFKILPVKFLKVNNVYG